MSNKTNIINTIHQIIEKTNIETNQDNKLNKNSQQIPVLFDIQKYKTDYNKNAISYIFNEKINLLIPIDGWGCTHFYEYFKKKFRQIYGIAYTGNTKLDLSILSEVLHKAYYDLKMTSSEVKIFIDWVCENNIKIFKSNGKIYFIGMLKNDINDFYNKFIFQLQVQEEKYDNKIRDIFIDYKDIRESIKKYIYTKNDNIDFDERLLYQLGVVVIIHFLVKQLCMNKMQAINTIKDKISKVKTKNNFANNIKKCFLNTILWEPYPFTDYNWRQEFDEIIKEFKIDKESWWKQEKPASYVKPANCLKILNRKKRK